MVAAEESIMSPVPQSSRDRILERIRKANTHAITHELSIPRAYDRASTRSADNTLALFEERLRDYDAGVFLVHKHEIAQKAAELLADRRIVIPQALPSEWLQEDIEWIPDHDLSFDTLNNVDGVMTAATIGVAVSGSIALQHGPGEGRRILTLLPDYHLCVIEAAQVVETLPEAFAHLDRARPITFFSGPSATADIEMTRIKGVHGPRFLDVLLVQD
jgi:L-lactate dehydrogenase complex protein LldG